MLRPFLLSIASVLFLQVLFAQTAGSIDLSFNPNDDLPGNGTGVQTIQTNRPVNAITIAPDNSIFFGGDFSSYNAGIYMHRFSLKLFENGRVDTTFLNLQNVSTTLSNSKTIAVKNDGKVLVGGTLSGSFQGFTIRGLVQLLPNGAIDSSFNIRNGFNGTFLEVKKLIVQPDGKILVAGDFTQYNDTISNRIIRLNEDGTIDNTFNIGTGADGAVNDIALQPDGKIILAGAFQNFNDTIAPRMVRLNNNGSIDGSFNIGTGFSSAVTKIHLQTDGKILATGNFNTFNGATVSRLIRLEDNGSRDTNFAITFCCTVKDMAHQPDGKIIIAGDVVNIAGNVTRKIARLNNNGTFDNTFVVPGTINTDIEAIALQPDGKILIGGDFTSVANYPVSRLARLMPDGNIDSTFNSVTGANGIINSAAIDEEDRIIIGGNFNSYNNVPINRFARLFPNGEIDTSFVNKFEGFNSEVHKVVIQPDGKILVGGDFTLYKGTTVSKLVRLFSNGDLDTTFSPSIIGGIRDIVLLNDGKMYIAGDFTTINGTSINRIARLLPNGNLDTTFNVGTGIGGQSISPIIVYAIALQNDSSILVGGSFNRFNSVTVSRLIRIDSTGVLDNTFSPNFLNNVHAVNLQPDGKILAGGNFGQVNGINISRLVRLNTNGTIDNSFIAANQGVNGLVYAITIQDNGKVLVGGGFSEFNGTPSNQIIRLNEDGSLDNDFSVGAPFSTVQSGIVNQILFQQNKIIVVGWFSLLGQTPRNGIARILKNCVAGTFAQSVNACSEYISANGNTYTSSGTFFETFQNTNGCDSIVQIDLTISDVLDKTVYLSGAILDANETEAQYQWLDCDNNYEPVSGETNQNFSPSTSGSFAVQLSNLSCIDTSACTYVLITNLSSSDKLKLQVYPNPAQNMVVVSSNQPVEIVLFDNTGRKLFAKQSLHRNHVLNIETLVDGIYHLHIFDNENAVIKKLVVMR